MSEDLKALITVGVSLIVAIIYSIYFFKVGSSKKRLIEKAKKRGNVVKATCIKTKRVYSYASPDDDPNRYEDLKVIYEYTVKGKKYRKKLYYSNDGVSINFPYEITLYYDALNPRRAYCQGELNEVGVGCFFTFLVFSITCFILVRIIT